MLKGTRLYSILFNKCPRCHESSFFKSDNPYRLKEFSEMNNKCEACGENFQRETGYYYGAMYVSYALNVALGVGLFLLLVVLLDIDVLYFLFSFIAMEIILFPWVFRTSRLVWINFFVGYKKKNSTAIKD